MIFKKRILLFCTVALFAKTLPAQIVNVEALRSDADSNGFYGRENLSASYTKNTRELWRISQNLNLQLRQNRHLWLFFNNIEISLSDNDALEQNGMLHLRYNFEQDDFLTWEVFSQYQKNIPLKINNRLLAGGGPRFSFIDKEKSKLYLGTLIMYEYDEEFSTDILNEDVRLSTYLSAVFLKKESWQWSSIAYYQPRVNKFEDFRATLQSQLSFQVFRKLSFTSTVSLAYDAFPVALPDIPNLTVNWGNGFSYKF